jgi:hypothetical protein
MMYPSCGGVPGPSRSCPIDEGATFFDEHGDFAPTYGVALGVAPAPVHGLEDFAGFSAPRPVADGTGLVTRVTRDGAGLTLDFARGAASVAQWTFQNCVATTL